MGVKDKVKGLKSRLPGMKKHGGEEDAHEDSSEYDETSPRGPVSETGDNVADSTPFTPGRATTESSSPNFPPREVHYPDSDSRPVRTGYDSQNTNYVAAAPLTPGKATTDSSYPRYSPRETQYPDSDSRPARTGYDSQNTNYVAAAPLTPGKATTDSSYPKYSPREVHFPDSDSRPAQTGYDSQNTNYVAAAPPTRPAPVVNDSPRSNLGPTLEERFQHLGVGQNPTSPHVDAGLASTDRGFQPEQQFSSPYTTSPHANAGLAPTDRGFQPEQQFSSPYTTESVQKGYSDVPQKGYSDVPRASYRSNSLPATAATNKGILEKVKVSVIGATAVLGDKLGYYNDHNPADPNAPSILSKAKSTLGVDKPRDPSAPALTERAKGYLNVASQKTREYSATAADHAAWTKDRVATHSTPTVHDKVLSQQVTHSLSVLPGAIKEKVFGPASPSSQDPNSPGIVDRVSGVVSSLFTAAPKNTGAHMQHTFPAHDARDAYATAGASGPPSAPAVRSSVPEGVAATSTPYYSTVNN